MRTNLLLIAALMLPIAAYGQREAYSFSHHAGQTFQVGTTYYDQQTNLNAVPQIAVDDSGNAHICWTNGIDPTLATRHVYYNSVSVEGTLFCGSLGCAMEASARAGYSCIDLVRDASGCQIPIVFINMKMDASPTAVSLAAYANDGGCLGGPPNFDFYNPARVLWEGTEMDAAWPHGCVSRGAGGVDLVHAAVSPSRAGVPPYNAYYHGTWDPFGLRVDWPGEPPLFLPNSTTPDSVVSVSSMFARSRISSKVSLCWIRNEMGPTPIEDPVHGFYYMALKRVVCYESTDGLTWDWATPKWVQSIELPDRTTRTIPESFRKPPSEIYPYYDNEDRLHVAFATAAWQDTSWLFTSDTLLTSPLHYKSDLKHWDEVTDTVTTIYSPGFFEVFRGGHAVSPAGHYWVQRPSMVSTRSGDLICVWEQILQADDTIHVDPRDSFTYGYTDIAVDNLLANSEIVATISFDNGLTWSRPTNLTNTYTPFCSGVMDSVCWSERDPSIALNTSVIGGEEYFHLTYVLDLHPGSIVYEGNPDNDIATNNPVMYQRVPIDFHFEDVQSPLVERPIGVRLSSPQPNPFIDRLDVAFSLPKEGPVLIEVVDLFGRVVATLSDGHFAPGEHRVFWDGMGGNGTKLGSGVYLLKLTAGGEVQVRRATKVE